MKNWIAIFISHPLASHLSGLYLLSTLSSLFTQSTRSNACFQITSFLIEQALDMVLHAASCLSILPLLFFSIVHFQNSERDLALEGTIPFFKAKWGGTKHEPCHVFDSTEIQLPIFISAPLTHQACNFSRVFPICSLPLRVEFWIKGALAFHKKSACHFHFTSSRIPSIRSLPPFLFVVSLYIKY
jgi:hypothetical protein